MSVIYLKQNDTAPSLVVTMKDADDNVVDLSQASGVVFNITNSADPSIAYSRSAAITDAPNGIVQYDYDAEDSSIVGHYKCEFVVTFNDGRIMTFPNDGYIELIVLQ